MTDVFPMRVIRDVAADEKHNYLGRDVKEGEIFYRCYLATYGCVDSMNGVALTQVPNEYPFFEFPLDAVEDADI
jgi:hypothetical protein